MMFHATYLSCTFSSTKLASIGARNPFEQPNVFVRPNILPLSWPLNSAFGEKWEGLNLLVLYAKTIPNQTNDPMNRSSWNFETHSYRRISCTDHSTTEHRQKDQQDVQITVVVFDGQQEEANRRREHRNRLEKLSHIRQAHDVQVDENVAELQAEHLRQQNAQERSRTVQTVLLDRHVEHLAQVVLKVVQIEY